MLELSTGTFTFLVVVLTLGRMTSSEAHWAVDIGLGSQQASTVRNADRNGCNVLSCARGLDRIDALAETARHSSAIKANSLSRMVIELSPRVFERLPNRGWLPLGRGIESLKKRKSDQPTSSFERQLLQLRGGGFAGGLRAAIAIAGLLAALISVNILQNGSPGRCSAPSYSNLSLDDAKTLRKKADFIAIWHAGKIPSVQNDYQQYDGYLMSLGVLAPASALITNTLFAPGRRWTGKVIGAQSGTNTFQSDSPSLGRLGIEKRSFRVTRAPSALDERDCLVLDYADKTYGDRLWGRVMGMKDELREVAPGLLFGLGSMRATGGALNCQPFVLVAK